MALSLQSTTDRYGNTVHVGNFVTARSLEFQICDLWCVSDIHANGTVDLFQRNGTNYAEISPDEIIRE
jgi:hypothetical protein